MNQHTSPSRRIRCAVGCLGLWLSMASAAADGAEHVIESSRDIPIARRVDVVVAGGSGGAVAVACAAARQGARVFLLAPRPYLGTDICSTLRLWLQGGERPQSGLARACFGEGRVTTPYTVKAAMDRALMQAGVDYLTGCYATDVLRDRSGGIAGVVMANRSGRQAIAAKVVVDATERAVVARRAGAAFRPFAPGTRAFRRVVAGGAMQAGDGVSPEKKPFTYDSVAGGKPHRLPVYEYTLRIAVEGRGLRALLRAEHRARDLTHADDAELAAERLFHVPADTVIGRARLAAWPGVDKAPLSPFRPKGIDRLYVLSAYADLADAAARRFLRPLASMATGERIGRAAAEEAAKLPPVHDAFVPEEQLAGDTTAHVGEDLGGIRPSELGTVHAGRHALPVFGRFDVIVVGGGTSGAPAGIAAATGGAKTLVIEYLHELGGVGTVGLIGKYWRGLRRGFTAYVDKQVNPGKDSWKAARKAEWFRRELIRCGAEVWFGVLGCGAVVQDARVCGVVVATPWGRGAALADVVIDATGNADVAAAAGAPTQYGLSERGSLNVQLAGFPDRPIGRSYVNTCYTMVDDTDVLDVWHLMRWKRTASGKPPAFDVGQLIDSRERRRVVGDYMLKTLDILLRRTFADTISQHYSNFDAAAFPDANLLLLADAKGPDYHTDLPYRCLLPKGLDGLLVVGLGCSADRDAMTLIRMQPDLQNQGYAAGLAAAAAAKLDGRTREVDIKAIQKRLVSEGVLDQRVLVDGDSYPSSIERIERAARAVGDAAKGKDLLHSLAVLLANPKRAACVMRARYRNTADKTARLRYAQILAVLGDATGAATLVEAVDAYDEWDPGVPLTSQRKTGNTFSRLDRLVIALGHSRAPAGLPALLAKLRQLQPDSKLSHFKAISLALRHHPPCEAASGPLRAILQRPGFTGHATIRPSAGRLTASSRTGGSLNRAYKELIVATLLYRCGDRDGTAATILKRYAQDVHGHFARYAQQVLAGTLTERGD